MANTPTKSFLQITNGKKFSNFAQLVEFYRTKKKCNVLEYTGVQTATSSAAEVTQVGGTIAYLGANDIVYARSEADLAALDGDSIFIDYVNSTGTIYEGVETKLDNGTSTDTEVPIGCENLVDAVSDVTGDVITLTAVGGTLVNQYAGWYIVACGDATDQEGAYLTVKSSTIATPVALTCTTTPNANWAADNVSLQSTLNNDVYRIRRMWTQTESPADNNQYICDKDCSNIYAITPDSSTRGTAGSRYFAPSSSYTSYLGKVECYAPQGFQADDESLCHQLTVTFTPKKETGTTTASDISLAMEFNDHFLWEPCIKLEPCTDVTFKIKKVLDSEDFIEVTLNYAVLEVY